MSDRETSSSAALGLPSLQNTIVPQETQNDPSRQGIQTAASVAENVATGSTGTDLQLKYQQLKRNLSAALDAIEHNNKEHQQMEQGLQNQLNDLKAGLTQENARFRDMGRSVIARIERMVRMLDQMREEKHRMQLQRDYEKRCREEVVDKYHRKKRLFKSSTRRLRRKMRDMGRDLTELLIYQRPDASYVEEACSFMNESLAT